MISRRSGLVLFLGVLLVGGCESTPVQSLPVTPEHQALFPGYYSQSLPGSVLVDMTISPAMEFEFNQPLAARKTKTVKGTLVITGPRTARAGRIKLEWTGRNTVDARSPYGTSMETGGSGGAAQGIVGAQFMMRRQ